MDLFVWAVVCFIGIAASASVMAWALGKLWWH